MSRARRPSGPTGSRSRPGSAPAAKATGDRRAASAARPCGRPSTDPAKSPSACRVRAEAAQTSICSSRQRILGSSARPGLVVLGGLVIAVERVEQHRPRVAGGRRRARPAQPLGDLQRPVGHRQRELLRLRRTSRPATLNSAPAVRAGPPSPRRPPRPRRLSPRAISSSIPRGSAAIALLALQRRRRRRPTSSARRAMSGGQPCGDVRAPASRSYASNAFSICSAIQKASPPPRTTAHRSRSSGGQRQGTLGLPQAEAVRAPPGGRPNAASQEQPHRIRRASDSPQPGGDGVVRGDHLPSPWPAPPPATAPGARWSRALLGAHQRLVGDVADQHVLEPPISRPSGLYHVAAPPGRSSSRPAAPRRPQPGDP